MGVFADIVSFLAKPENFGPLVAGTAGAAFGSWGTQIAIGRAQKRQDIATELRVLASAHTLAFTICNTFLATKKQHVLVMQENREAVRKSYEAFLVAPRAEGYRPVFEFAVDFRTFAPDRSPILPLEGMMYEKISIKGRAVAATAALHQAIEGLATSINYRNALIEDWHRTRLPPAELLSKVLGLETEVGRDTKYPSICDAIVAQTDDCIFYSKLVTTDLEEYGIKLRKRYRFRFWGLPTMPRTDMSNSEIASLLPAESEYERWTKGFVQKPKRVFSTFMPNPFRKK